MSIPLRSTFFSVKNRFYHSLKAIPNCFTIRQGEHLGPSFLSPRVFAQGQGEPICLKLQRQRFKKSSNSGYSNFFKIPPYLMAGICGFTASQEEEESAKRHLPSVFFRADFREGILDIKYFSLDQLKSIFSWIKINRNYHPFLHLKGVEAFKARHKDIQQEVNSLIKKIKAEIGYHTSCFADRATPFECAQFCQLVYKIEEEIEKGLPDKWTILKGDRDERKGGFFSLAFINHETRNVIIAHRGRIETDIKTLLSNSRADFNKILKQDAQDRQERASKFARKVYKLANGWRYKVGCVGHSLGGKLAQITAHDLLKEQHKKVYTVSLNNLRSKKTPGLIEPHDLDYPSFAQKLNITIYVLFSNLSKTCGAHPGSLFKTPFEEISTQEFECFNFADTFREESMFLKQCVYSPVSSLFELYTEYEKYRALNPDFDAEKVRLSCLPATSRELLEQINAAKCWRNYSEDIELFLREVARKLGIDFSELKPLDYYSIRGGFFSAKNAVEKCEKLSLIAPKLIGDNSPLSVPNYCSFLAKRCSTPPSLEKDLPIPLFKITRRKEVEEIKQHFKENDLVVIKGDKATGKSELARQYADHFKNETKEGSVFSLSISSENAEREWLHFALSILRIDYDIKNPPTPREIQKKIVAELEARDNYLFIIKGAQGLDKILNYLPKGNGKGKFIIISSSSTFSINSKIRCPMSIEDKKDLFLRVRDKREKKSLTKNYGEGYLKEKLGKKGIEVLEKLDLHSIKLIARYFALHPEEKREEFLDKIKKSELKALANLSINNIIEAFIEKHSLIGENLVAIFPLLDGKALSKELLIEWLSFEYPDLEKKKWREAVDDLEDYGIIEKINSRVGVNTAFSIAPQVQDQLKNSSFTSKELDQKFFRFLRSKIEMQNIDYKDLKKNQLICDAKRCLDVLKLTTQPENELFIPALFLLLAIGNNYLQNELYISSEEMFSQVKAACERAANKRYGHFLFKASQKTSPETARKVKEQLGKIHPELPNLFFRSLHYLGRIYLHENRLSQAEDYLESALALQKTLVTKKSCSDRDQKMTDEEIHHLIFRRRGQGFLMLKTAKNLINAGKHEEGRELLEKTVKLYLGLYQESSFSFNQLVCNLQLVRTYSALAKSANNKEEREKYYDLALKKAQKGYEEKDLEKFKDIKAETLLELGKLFSNPDTSFYKPQIAEDYFLKVLQEGIPEKNTLRYRTDNLFEAHYLLAKKYKGEIRNYPNLKKIFLEENGGNLFEAKIQARRAFDQLHHCPYETFLVYCEEKKEEIKELEAILNLEVNCDI